MSKLNKKIKLVKADLHSVQVSLVKKLGDDFEKTDRMMSTKLEGLRKNIAACDKTAADEKERVNRNLNLIKKEMGTIRSNVDAQMDR